MHKYAIAFANEGQGILLRLIDASSPDEAMRLFFDAGVEGYSPDSEGYAWFSEDFSQEPTPQGAIARIDG
jgi:hypothetical protein